ncbi:MAG: MotA/TolQ/ExbB proton channel family protein, partial [Planctomycetota bacterium]
PTAPAAQSPTAPPGQTAEAESTDGAPSGLWEILKAGGIVGLVIMLLSIAVVALAVEHALTLRAKVLMPPGLADEVHRLLTAKRWQDALASCRGNPSVLGHVLAAGLIELEGGWPEVEKAMEEALAEQSARLLRKVEYLSVIGNIAPMLGLLGTVIGMILAFRHVAETQGAARAADLAQGIYLALVTTVEGLIVAIPSLAVYAFFRNRVDELIAETAAAAQHACRPLKRLRVVRTPAPPAPPADRT